jgi:hypothetical protein
LIQYCWFHGSNESMSLGHYWVELDRGWCDCGNFQAFRMPCSHVIAACSKVRRDSSYLLSDVYKVISLSNVYNNNFLVVAKKDYWSVYQGDILWHNEKCEERKRVAQTTLVFETKWIRRTKWLDYVVHVVSPVIIVLTAQCWNKHNKIILIVTLLLYIKNNIHFIW